MMRPPFKAADARHLAGVVRAALPDGWGVRSDVMNYDQQVGVLIISPDGLMTEGVFGYEGMGPTEEMARELARYVLDNPPQFMGA